jgi:hypothetical protein
MPIAHRIARSIEGFTKIVCAARDEWHLQEVLPWFRGHSDAEWALTPKFYRQRDKTRLNEDNVREEFITRAPTLSDVTPGNRWDWYFLMQHHGAPTRLLDWTEGALIALYFAVRENPGYHDAAVWVLDPWELNIKVVGKDEVVPPGDPGTTSEDRRRYDRWLPDRFARRKRWPKWPVAIYPGHIARRITAQRSCFTIHGSESCSLEEVGERMHIPLMKISVPSWECKVIRRSLETCGLDESTVFPDLEGLSKVMQVRWMQPDERSPHHGAFTRLRPSKEHKGGVGVFAIRKIRKNFPIFVGDNSEMLWVEDKDLPKRPRSVRKLYEDFAVVRKDKKDRKVRRWYGCPVAFNRLTLSWYVSHSSRPNLRCDENLNFFALRDIEAEEELTADYSTYSEKVLD